MADRIQRLIELLPHHGLSGKIESAWRGSRDQVEFTAARRAIRDSVLKSLPDLDEPSREALSDLNKSPPRLTGFSLSISHCRHAGGWLAVPKTARVGFDIEDLTRISDTVIRRISTPEEIKASPDPRYLWSAKEALFKANAGHVTAPPVASALVVTSWREKAPGEVLFSETGGRGAGALIAWGTLILAAFLVTECSTEVPSHIAT